MSAILWIGNDGRIHLKTCNPKKRYQALGVKLPLPFVLVNRCSECGQYHEYEAAMSAPQLVEAS